MNHDAKIYVAGHRGLVGSAIVRCLHKEGYSNLLTATSNELDLREQAEVRGFFSGEKPDYVFLAAARVGGILANSGYPADFIYQNLMIEVNVIESARQAGVEKLVFLGSSCIYPRLAPQPLKEEYLLTGSLEPSNEWYAVAKIAGIKLCQAYQRQYGCQFISVMPTNLYGPQDNFDSERSHVIPAMIRKFHQAKVDGEPEVIIWGTGTPRREFLHVDDCAEACVFLMNGYSGKEIVNIGVGKDISIAELADRVRRIVGYEGKLVFDTGKPDGTPRKLLDTSRLNTLGWQAKITLEDGVRATYDWYLEHVSGAAG